MSLPDHIKAEKNTFKPNLQYGLGTQVFLKSDEKRKYPMLITGFDLDPDYCSDYHVKWVNSQGGIERDIFPEECLTK